MVNTKNAKTKNAGLKCSGKNKSPNLISMGPFTPWFIQVLFSYPYVIESWRSELSGADESPELGKMSQNNVFKSFDPFGRRLGLTVGRFKKSSLLEPIRLDHAAPYTTLQPNNEALAFVGNFASYGASRATARQSSQGRRLEDVLELGSREERT